MMRATSPLPNLLFFSNHLRGPHGSAGARSWHQAKHLADKFNVSVILPAIDPVTASAVTPDTYAGLPENVEVNLAGVTRNDRSNIWRRACYYASAVPRQLALGLKSTRPEVVLSMGLPVTTLGVAWLTSVLRSARFVVDVRDMPFETAAEVGYLKSRAVLAILRGLEGFLLRRADAVLTNSPRYKSALAARGVEIDRITVAHIGYDNFEEPPVEKVAAWRAGLKAALAPETQMIGVYSGTLGYAFPVEEILEGARALASDRRFGFVFLGDGQRLNDFRRFAEKHRLNAYFTGRVNKQDVMAVCRAADYCIYPANLGEFSAAGLGNKVFDYLGAERPVLYVGGDSAVRDLLDELNAGLAVAKGDPAAFAAAVRRLLDEPDLANQLRVGAAQLVPRGYTAENAARTLCNLISDVIGHTQEMATEERG